MAQKVNSIFSWGWLGTLTQICQIKVATTSVQAHRGIKVRSFMFKIPAQEVFLMNGLKHFF
jgi:hypothetical protein